MKKGSPARTSGNKKGIPIMNNPPHKRVNNTSHFS